MVLSEDDDTTFQVR